ncbi:hypothetical protein KC19_12G189500 [Ceratodon purpureus]|uniref:Uncharacterized protein n=1 Tax=Ceratodon purpureus TaxID=3225 RepID=A0A8T0GD05_CERPU|nr:hypothetical protein KC19_12G189500 [Ceratodon purpureus]
MFRRMHLNCHVDRPRSMLFTIPRPLVSLMDTTPNRDVKFIVDFGSTRCSRLPSANRHPCKSQQEACMLQRNVGVSKTLMGSSFPRCLPTPHQLATLRW